MLSHGGIILNFYFSLLGAASVITWKAQLNSSQYSFATFTSDFYAVSIKLLSIYYYFFNTYIFFVVLEECVAWGSWNLWHPPTFCLFTTCFCMTEQYFTSWFENVFLMESHLSTTGRLYYFSLTGLTNARCICDGNSSYKRKQKALCSRTTYQQRIIINSPMFRSLETAGNCSRDHLTDVNFI